jgi:porphobilinogen deaminase
LRAVGGDCKTPLGAHAERLGDTLRLRAFVAPPGGGAPIWLEREAPWPASEQAAEAFGRAAGERLK